MRAQKSARECDQRASGCSLKSQICFSNVLACFSIVLASETFLCSNNEHHTPYIDCTDRAAVMHKQIIRRALHLDRTGVDVHSSTTDTAIQFSNNCSAPNATTHTQCRSIIELIRNQPTHCRRDDRRPSETTNRKRETLTIAKTC